MVGSYKILWDPALDMWTWDDNMLEYFRLNTTVLIGFFHWILIELALFFEIHRQNIMYGDPFEVTVAYIHTTETLDTLLMPYKMIVAASSCC